MLELLQWSAIQSESCSGNTRSFSPTHVYSVSTTETLVTANSSMLYRLQTGLTSRISDQDTIRFNCALCIYTQPMQRVCMVPATATNLQQYHLLYTHQQHLLCSACHQSGNAWATQSIARCRGTKCTKELSRSRAHSMQNSK